jgi:HlyD family secretion protein
MMFTRRRIAILIASVAVFFIWRLFAGDESESTFILEDVRSGDLDVAISATGTVQPEEVIDVGAQVAGQIREFGIDAEGKPVDFGSEIEAGTVLAKIDESVYLADLSEAKARLAQAQASESEAKARLTQATNDWKRAEQLGPSEALSKSEFDGYRAAFDVAGATLKVAAAAVLQAQAGVDRAERNLGYCTIKSPVRGVIIDRRVNIGQTVVASLSAPSLFLIAKDLTKMQVWASVNEADVGKIRSGQPVSFRVDALPNDIFRGEVRKVRLNASMTQNVVTYTVEVSADNSEKKLLPYLTANVRFEIASAKGIVLVPTAALKFSPDASEVSRDQRQRLSELQGRQAKTTFRDNDHVSTSPGIVWIDEGSGISPIEVEVGMADRGFAEARGIEPGKKVIVGRSDLDSEQARGNSNPFAPPRMRGGRR